MENYVNRYFKTAKFKNGMKVFYYAGKGQFKEGIIKRREFVECGKDGEGGIVRYEFGEHWYDTQRILERFVTTLDDKETLIKEITKEIQEHGEPDLINVV